MDEECPICLEILEGTIVILNCNHKYHGECLEQWFNSSAIESENICPQCNLEVCIKNIVDIPNEKDKNAIINLNNLNNNNYNKLNTVENEQINYEEENRNKCFKKCNIM